MKKLFAAALAASCLVGVSPAVAATVDADAFANGTDIGTAFAGVTLQTVNTSSDVSDVLSVGSVYSVTDAFATTGTRAFGQTSNDSTWGNGSFEYLLVTFDSTVSSVSLDFFANDSSDSNPQLLAFDSVGTLLGTTSAGSVPLGSPITLSVNFAGIKSVRAYWDELTRGDNGGLDNLVYEAGAVPEASTWAMMIAGFGLAGAAMRRRAKIVLA